MSDLIRPIGIVCTTREVQRILRTRAEEVNYSREVLDELAGLTPGHSAKLLCDPPIKELGPKSMWELMGALGLLMAVIENPNGLPALAHRKPRRIDKYVRRGRQHGKTARALAHAAEWGRQGAIKRRSKMTDEAFVKHQSKAAKARWRKWRRDRRARRKLARTARELVTSCA